QGDLLRRGRFELRDERGVFGRVPLVLGLRRGRWGKAERGLKVTLLTEVDGTAALVFALGLEQLEATSCGVQLPADLGGIGARDVDLGIELGLPPPKFGCRAIRLCEIRRALQWLAIGGVHAHSGDGGAKAAP